MLSKDDEIQTKYQDTINSDFKKGFREKMSQNDLSHIEIAKIRFLPHHPVYNPHKPGKAGRVCNLVSRESLNDKLLPGPNLCRSLC